MATRGYNINLSPEKINEIIRDYANKLFTLHDSAITRYKEFERSKKGDSIKIPEPLIKEYAWKTRIEILNQDNKTKELLEGEKTKKKEQQRYEIDSLKETLQEKELELEETTTNIQRIREDKERNTKGIEATKRRIQQVAGSNP
ncbi:hypothetical protein IJM86_07675 [bacterium]|nr:hypothetical protein [bacterium]